MSALQQIRTIFDYFFGSDVELREGQNGTSEVWARKDDEGKFMKFAVLCGDESLTDIRLIALNGNAPVEIERKLMITGAFDMLIRHLEKFVGTGGSIYVDRGTGLRAEVDVIACYEDIGYDENGEPFTVDPPVIARLRFDRDQDILTAR